MLTFRHPTVGNSIWGKRIKLYTYSNNKIYIHLENQFFNPTSSIYIQNDTLTPDANNNIILKHSSNNNSSNNSSIITNYSYGNNPSPLINLNIWDKLGICFEDGDFYLIQGMNNNLTSLKISVYENGVLQGTHIVLDNSDTYTFDPNGYPNSINFHFPINPNSFTRKIIYVYKSL